MILSLFLYLYQFPLVSMHLKDYPLLTVRMWYVMVTGYYSRHPTVAKIPPSVSLPDLSRDHQRELARNEQWGYQGGNRAMRRRWFEVIVRAERVSKEVQRLRSKRIILNCIESDTRFIPQWHFVRKQAVDRLMAASSGCPHVVSLHFPSLSRLSLCEQRLGYITRGHW